MEVPLFISIAGCPVSWNRIRQHKDIPR